MADSATRAAVCRTSAAPDDTRRRGPCRQHCSPSARAVRHPQPHDIRRTRAAEPAISHRRLRPEGLAADLRALHRERGAPRRAGRPAAASVRHQAARRGRDAPGRRPHPRDPRVPAGDDEPERDDAARLAAREPGGLPARAAAHRAPAPGGPRPRERDGVRPGRPRPQGALRLAAQAVRQGAAAGRRARRPARRRAGRRPPPRPLRPWRDHGDVAVLGDHRPAVLLHGPRQGHLLAVAEPRGAAAAQASGGALLGHLHRGQRAPPEGHRPGGGRPPCVSRPERRLRAADGGGERRAGARLERIERPSSWGRPTARCRAPRAEEGLRRRRRRVRRARPPRRPVRGRHRRPRRRGGPGPAPAHRRARTRRARPARGPDEPGRPLRRVPPRVGVLPAVPDPRQRRPRRHPERARRGDGRGRAGRHDAGLGHPRDRPRRRDRPARRARRPARGRRRGAAPARRRRPRRADLRAGTGDGAARARQRAARPRPRDALRGGGRVSAAHALADEHRIAPRPVFCVIGHVHRDRAVAEDACAGRFTIAGQEVDVGPRPDWVGAALPADREWRIEWTKFYFGLDLANAYAETGEARFLAAWERLVGSYLRELAPGEGHDDSSDVAARRVQNWIYAWAAFAAVPGFPGVSPGLERELLDGIRAHAAYVRDNLTAERNHRTLELYALLIVSLALPVLDPGAALRTLAIDQLHENLLCDVREDGVHREQSTHYHCIALRSFLGARENARRFGLTLPDGYDERLARACEFAMHCHRPDGGIPALSDSDSGSYLELLALAADLLGRDDLRWVATGGRAGTPPARRCPSFPRGGYHVQRSGWGDRGAALRDERYLIFDTGPIGDGGHGHYDLMAVEVAAGGRPVLVDPGRYTYDEGEPNLRHWFKGTAAHNTVVVDGLDQTPYRPGKPRKGTIARGRLVERHGAPGLDIVAGEATSTVYDAVHSRRVAFVFDEYWLIEDRLEAPTAHRYDLRFHLAAEAQDEVTVERRGDVHVVRAPGLALVIHGPGTASVEPGWVAPAYGVKRPAPVVSIVVEGARDATFTTAVVPLAAAAEVPSVVVRQEDETTTVDVETPAVADSVRWSDAGAPLDLGPLRCVATAGVMRRAADGAVRAVAAGVGGGPVWTAWDSERGMSAGREGEQ